MGWNGSGTFSITYAGNPVVTGTTISSTWANGTLGEVATGLTTCLTKDGQNSATANLPMGGFKHTNVANGSARTDYAALGQVQDSAATYLTGVAGTDTITASVTGLAAYAAGQVFRFISAGANTGAVTLNVNALGAKAVTKQGTTALVANDIASGVTVEVIYDGTRFQVVNITGTVTLVAATLATLTVEGNATVGNTTTNGARILTVSNANAGSSASAAVTATSDAGSISTIIGSTAQGAASVIVSSAAGGLSIYTSGATSLQIGTNNTPGRLTIDSAGAVNAAVSMSENSTRVYSRNSSYTGTSAITSNTVHTFAHSLGAAPSLIRVTIECTSNDNGYVVGDVIDIIANSTGTTQMVNTYSDATNVYVIVKNGISAVNPTSVGSAIAGLTMANWTMRVRAWY